MAVEVAAEAFYTVEEVAAHSSKDDCWVIVHDGARLPQCVRLTPLEAARTLQ